jgi:hypothetical protein
MRLILVFFLLPLAFGLNCIDYFKNYKEYADRPRTRSNIKTDFKISREFLNNFSYSTKFKLFEKRPLGGGVSSTIFKGYIKEDNKRIPVAIKTMKRTSGEDFMRFLKFYLTEIKTLCTFTPDPQFLKIYEWGFIGNDLVIITELASEEIYNKLVEFNL